MYERILVADDDDSISRLVSRMIGIYVPSHITPTIDIVSSGEAGVQIVKEHEYDLAFLDLRMPPGNGFDVYDAIREQDVRRGADTSIVIMSGHMNDNIIDRLALMDLLRIINKPRDIRCIEGVLQNVYAHP